VIWVGEPLTVRVQGLLDERHDFAGSTCQLAQLQRPLWRGPARVRLADGMECELLPLSRWRPRWLLWQGESELGEGRPVWAARRAELVYRATRYFILPVTVWEPRYRLINEADAEVLTIAFRGPLRREAELVPQVALELTLVVFAYDLASRLL